MKPYISWFDTGKPLVVPAVFWKQLQAVAQFLDSRSQFGSLSGSNCQLRFDFLVVVACSNEFLKDNSGSGFLLRSCYLIRSFFIKLLQVPVHLSELDNDSGGFPDEIFAFDYISGFYIRFQSIRWESYLFRSILQKSFRSQFISWMSFRFRSILRKSFRFRFIHQKSFRYLTIF